MQYTRNMATGASTADVAIILIDARLGVLEQTARHAYIASLLGIPHLVVCVNKMDLVGYDRGASSTASSGSSALRAQRLDARTSRSFPISALNGDNVVDRSDEMDWFGGLPLLEHLETLELESDHNLVDARFPVQWVIRDHDSDYRGYAGEVAGGILRPGDDIVVLPSGVRSSIAAIDTYDGPLSEAFPPMSVTLRLADDVDVSRGDLIVRVDPGADAPIVTREFEADVCWMTEAPLRPGARLALKHNTSTVRAIADTLIDRLDIHSLDRNEGPEELGLNDIGRVRIRVSRELAVDPYSQNRTTGSFILLDESSNETVGGGMIR